MGILLKRSEDGEVYQDAYSEAQRIIRISDEVKISVDVVEKEQVSQKNQNIEIAKKYDTLTVAKLAEKWGVTTEECNAKLCHAGLQEIDGKFHRLTDTGKKAGALIKKGRYGYFIVWPDSLTLEMVEAAGNNQIRKICWIGLLVGLSVKFFTSIKSIGCLKAICTFQTTLKPK